MDISRGIIFGILAFLCWGVADFAAALSSKRFGELRTYFWMQVTGLCIASLYLFSTDELHHLSWQMVPWTFVSGFVYVIGYLAFYRGLSRGKVSVVSPLAGSWALITTILSLLFLGESLNPLQILGIISVVAGIILVSSNLAELRSGIIFDTTSGSIEGIIAMSCMGLGPFFFILAGREGNTWFLPVLMQRIFALMITVAYVLLTRKNVSLGRHVTHQMWGLAIVGILDTIGMFALSFGSIIGAVSITAPVSASFPIVTVILAMLFLKERLQPTRILGIIATIGGVVLLSL
jgi:drug/metabolite transporter (DMT)-like permease